MRRYYVCLTLVLMLILALLPIYPASADVVATPESINISNIMVFRNLAETGDSLYLFHYSMPYASDNYPDTPASQAVMFRLYDSDGTTVKQTSKPYVNPFFGSNGYGEGIGSFYFGASDNASAWESAVVINIVGPSPLFDPSWEKASTLTESNYTTSTTQEANRAELEAYILLEADDMAADYADTGIVLKTTSDSGIVLSVYGELYFRGAINGLQNLCPDLFFIQTLIPEQMAVQTYNMTMMDTYTNRLDDDDLGKGFERLGALIGVSKSFAGGMICFAITLTLAIITIRKQWGAEPGLLGGALCSIGLALIVGDVVFMVVVLGSLVAAMGIAWLVFIKRS